jgi:hypothetical protein
MAANKRQPETDPEEGQAMKLWALLLVLLFFFAPFVWLVSLSQR